MTSILRILNPGCALFNFRTTFALLLTLGFRVAIAQEMLGVVNSSYAGITGSMINPATPVTSPYFLDINFLSGDLFVENNFVYMAKEEYRFRRFLSTNPQFPRHGVENNLIVYDYYKKNDKKAYANLRILGPSAAITFGRHSFGIVTGARFVSSTKNLAYEMAKFGLEKLEYPPQYDINYVDSRNVYNAEMAWAEYGINYSYVIKQQGLDHWSAGITLKRLKGYAGAYVTSDDVDYVVLDRDTLIVHNFNGEAGYSLPLNYTTNDFMSDPIFRGKGIGLDIGVIYQKKKSYVRNDRFTRFCDQRYIPYKYKIGISILDIGKVKFTQNSEKLVFQDASTYWPGITWLEFTSMRNLTDTLSQQFYGNHTQLIQGNEINIVLPTAVSFQADYNYMGNWFINGTMVYPIQYSKSGIIRPVLFGLTPRYQTTLFEASIPLTLYDWTKPRIGFSARFRGFYIGTEKLSGFFHFTDFTGIDFYAGLKLSLHKGNCRNSPSDNCGYEEYKKYTKKKSTKK